MVILSMWIMINIVVIFSQNLSKKHSPRVKITSIPSWLHYNFDIALNKGQCSGKLTCTFCLLKFFKFAGVLNNNCTYLERTQAFCHDLFITRGTSRRYRNTYIQTTSQDFESSNFIDYLKRSLWDGSIRNVRSCIRGADL